MSINISAADRGFIYGAALGDGYITKSGGAIRIKHSSKQYDYLVYKAHVLGRILSRNNPVKLFNNSGYPGARWSAGNAAILRPIRADIYRDGVKDWTRPGLFDVLTDESLALIWMDDGNITYKKRDGRIHARVGYLSIYYDDRTKLQTVADLFTRRFDILFTTAKDSHGYRLYLSAHALRKLVVKIRPYIHHSMLYKVDMRYTRTTYVEYNVSSPTAGR